MRYETQAAGPTETANSPGTTKTEAPTTQPVIIQMAANRFNERLESSTNKSSSFF